MGSQTGHPSALTRSLSIAPSGAPPSKLPRRGWVWPWQEWPSEARLLLGLVALWCLVGLLVLASASWWVASREMGDGGYYIKRQLIWMAASWGLLVLGVRLSLRRWLHLAPLALLAGCLMVALTLVMGSTVNGASRWLVLGPLQIQPSELVKPFVVLQGAALGRHPMELEPEGAPGADAELLEPFFGKIPAEVAMKFPIGPIPWIPLAGAPNGQGGATVPGEEGHPG